MDFSQEKVQQQFSELGLKPEDVIQKVSHSSSSMAAAAGLICRPELVFLHSYNRELRVSCAVPCS
jgi:hypothetical protein